jgi:hypothetical protein
LKGALPLPKPPVAMKTDIAMGDKTKFGSTKGQSVENKNCCFVSLDNGQGIVHTVHLNVL